MSQVPAYPDLAADTKAISSLWGYLKRGETSQEVFRQGVSGFTQRVQEEFRTLVSQMPEIYIGDKKVQVRIDELTINYDPSLGISARISQMSIDGRTVKRNTREGLAEVADAINSITSDSDFAKFAMSCNLRIIYDPAGRQYSTQALS